MDPPFHHIYLAIGILVIVANIFQIIAIWKTNKKLNIPSIFILNLSISDLLIGLVLLVNSSIDYRLQRTISHGEEDELEKYQRALADGSMTISSVISTSNLIVIAFDRLYCIVKPIKYRTHNRNIAILIWLVLWIICILTVITNYLMEGQWANILPYVVFPTLVILMSVYIYIWIYIRKNNESVHKTNTVRKKQERRLLIMSCSVVVAFMISFLPSSVYTLYKDDWCNDILYAILYCNSLMNPVIYLTFIRRKIYNTLKKTWPRCCNSTANPAGTKTQDTETVSYDTNNSRNVLIKSEKVPISTGNIEFNSNCACTSVHSSDSGNVFVVTFKLRADIDDNNTTYFNAHKKREDKFDIEAETIYD